jgi:glycosyltransferase involved in cell wall biosynthesis
MLWDKGIREFAQAAELFKAKGIKARFVLVGGTDSGNPASVPKNWLIEMQEKGIMEWWNHRDDMNRILLQAHIICLPSYREGLPKVLIEAASCGRAIVATDVPGCREIVKHGVNGLLVPARQHIPLADALEALLVDAEKRREMGAIGRAMVLNEFSEAQVVRETLAIYSGKNAYVPPEAPSARIALSGFNPATSQATPNGALE